MKLIVSKERLRNSNLGGYNSPSQGDGEEPFNKGCIKCSFLNSTIGFRNLKGNEMINTYWNLIGTNAGSKADERQWGRKPEYAALMSVLDRFEFALQESYLLLDPPAEWSKHFIEDLITELDEKSLVTWEEDLNDSALESKTEESVCQVK